MGYDDEAERSRNRRSRARQPVKRMGDREIEQRRYREPGHSQPGLNLITDTFREQEEEARKKRTAAGEAEKQTQRRAGEGQWNLQYPCQKKGKKKKKKDCNYSF